MNFAFETTLASRSFAPWVSRLVGTGYRVHLLFLSLPTADFAVERVGKRVKFGGHAIQENVIRRRFSAGLRNFFALYTPCVSSWILYDNIHPGIPLPIASGVGSAAMVTNHTMYERFKQEFGNG